MSSFKTQIAQLPWWCRRILSLAISYYGWMLVGTGGGTHSASYCYGIWKKHLATARQNGMSAVPNIVVEIGPGSSIGVGIAALLSGANRYVAFDRVRHADVQRDVRHLKDLIMLFKNDHINVPQARVDAILQVLTSQKPYQGISIVYVAPWDGISADALRLGSVDMICSQVVMEYVDDVEATCGLFANWLKPGGFVSHHIDFSCHTLARHWNGHWAYPSKTWRFMEGTRPYRLNRQSHSVHINALKQQGFRIVCDVRTIETSGIQRRELAPEFANWTDEDLVTRSAFIQAIK